MSGIFSSNTLPSYMINMFLSETISAVVTTWGNKYVFSVDIPLKFGLVKRVRPVKLKMEYFFPRTYNCVYKPPRLKIGILFD